MYLISNFEVENRFNHNLLLTLKERSTDYDEKVRFDIDLKYLIGDTYKDLKEKKIELDRVLLDVGSYTGEIYERFEERGLTSEKDILTLLVFLLAKTRKSFLYNQLNIFEENVIKYLTTPETKILALYLQQTQPFDDVKLFEEKTIPLFDMSHEDNLTLLGYMLDFIEIKDSYFTQFMELDNEIFNYSMEEVYSFSQLVNKARSNAKCKKLITYFEKEITTEKGKKLRLKNLRKWSTLIFGRLTEKRLNTIMELYQKDGNEIEQLNLLWCINQLKDNNTKDVNPLIATKVFKVASRYGIEELKKLPLTEMNSFLRDCIYNLKSEEDVVAILNLNRAMSEKIGSHFRVKYSVFNCSSMKKIVDIMLNGFDDTDSTDFTINGFSYSLEDESIQFMIGQLYTDNIELNKGLEEITARLIKKDEKLLTPYHREQVMKYASYDFIRSSKINLKLNDCVKSGIFKIYSEKLDKSLDLPHLILDIAKREQIDWYEVKRFFESTFKSYDYKEENYSLKIWQIKLLSPYFNSPSISNHFIEWYLENNSPLSKEEVQNWRQYLEMTNKPIPTSLKNEEEKEKMVLEKIDNIIYKNRGRYFKSNEILEKYSKLNKEEQELFVKVYPSTLENTIYPQDIVIAKELVKLGKITVEGFWNSMVNTLKEE